MINSKFNDWDFTQSRKSYIKNLLKDNSFFINKFLVLKNRLNFYLNSKNNKNDLLSSYSPRKKEFKKIGIKYELKKNLNIKDYSEYNKIFSELILQTRNLFLKSKIIIIQQQIPGCNFVSKKIVYDKHPFESSNYCADLLKVFQLQEKIFESRIRTNIKLIPMYLNKIIYSS